MEVSVSCASGAVWLLPFSMRELSRALEGMALGMRPATGEKPAALELSLLDDADMAALNRDFLGLSGPTNVLSFPAAAGETGSLALAVPTVLREARLYGQEEGAYIIRMLAHGLAHIMGYEHGPEMDIEVERAMEAIPALLTGDGNR